MNEQEKSLLLRRNLKKQINTWDISGYLHEEVCSFLGVLSSWKLEKLTTNFPMFKKFVYLLDDQNTKQMWVKHGVGDYYLSKRGATLLAKKKKVSIQDDVNTHIVRVSGKIKAIFVFQATEFCNGSVDRMKIVDFAKIRASIMQKCKKM